MKNIGLLLAFMLAFIAAKSENDVDRKLEKSESLEGVQIVQVKNYGSDLEVIHGDLNRLQLNTIIRAKNISMTDFELLIKAIEQIKIEKQQETIYLDTRFYNSFQSVPFKSKMKLITGEQIKMGSLEVRFELIIPNDKELKTDLKYAKFKLGEHEGVLNAVLYDCDAEIKGVRKESSINVKYGNLQLDKARDLKLSLYDTDLEAEKIGNLILKTKYSKVSIGKVAQLQLNAYDDEIDIGMAEKTTIIDKYSKLSFEQLDELQMNLYDSEVSVEKCEQVDVKSRYSDLNIEECGDLRATSYDDDIVVGNTKSVLFNELKYSDIKIKVVDGNIDYRGYDSSFIVYRVNKDFKRLNLDGKYGKVSLAIEQPSHHEINASLKYGKLEIIDERYQDIRVEKDQDNQITSAVTKNTDGKPGKINLVGYDVKIEIK